MIKGDVFVIFFEFGHHLRVDLAPVVSVEGLPNALIVIHDVFRDSKFDCRALGSVIAIDALGLIAAKWSINVALRLCSPEISDKS